MNRLARELSRDNYPDIYRNMSDADIVNSYRNMAGRLDDDSRMWQAVQAEVTRRGLLAEIEAPRKLGIEALR